MKRYRVLAFDFDSRANILNQEICESWQPDVKEMWKRNKEQMINGLVDEYGSVNFSHKLQNFRELDAMPISLIAFHNDFYRQARSAFVIGSYYPALTAICALGERVLNHLILLFRDNFKSTDEYKAVYKKSSFDNWDLAINTLESWGILLSTAANTFRSLRDIRNRVIHFNHEIDQNHRSVALVANNLFIKIVNEQFSAFGLMPWYIEGTPGAMFVKKDFENQPFVDKIVLPNCQKVGYKHLLEHSESGWIVQDDNIYEKKEVTDAEFKDLFNNRVI